MKCSLASVESFILPHEDDIMFTSHVFFFTRGYKASSLCNVLFLYNKTV